MKHKTNMITSWAFLLGAIVAIIFGIGASMSASWASNQWIPVILVVLGLVVGLINITAQETVPFLVAAIALLAFGSGGLSTLDTLIPKLGTLLGSTVQAFSFFVGAAAIVVAVKETWMLASKK
jgi:hypothetical protein